MLRPFISTSAFEEILNLPLAEIFIVPPELILMFLPLWISIPEDEVFIELLFWSWIEISLFSSLRNILFPEGVEI